MCYSDSVRICKEWVFTRDGNKFLKYDSKKTGNEVILPIKPKAWKLLQKYNYDLSGDSNQEANRKLKIIGAMAGIVDVVKEGEKEGPKCSFMASHTARRSAATQMYLQGVSIKMIADLGGWKDFDNLKLYLRSSMMDAAVTAQGLEFFK